MKAQLNKSLKFGGAVHQNVLDASHCSNLPLTLSDIIPCFDPVGPLLELSTYSQQVFRDHSLCKSTLTKEPDLPQQCPRVASDVNRKLKQVK